MNISHTKLSTILSCPMTYYLQYEQGIVLKDKPAPLRIGSAVHWGIEHSTCDLTDFFEHEARNKDNYTKEQMLAEAMVGAYLERRDDLFKSEILIDPETREPLTLLDETHELFVEAPLKSLVKAQEDNVFVGIIDLLLTTDKGFVVIDYKTSTYEPDWDSYTDQLYRYVYELKQIFPDIPVVKVGIVNIRKTSIRQRKNESDFDFRQRMLAEYIDHGDAYLTYHEYPVSELNDEHFGRYIENLQRTVDAAVNIVNNKLWFINYTNANGTYGRSQYWDIFYRTPGAEVLYEIRDFVWDEDTNGFVLVRDCVDIDMRVIDDDRILNKYEAFKNELLDTTAQTKEEFFGNLRKKYLTNESLLELYWLTYIKEKEKEVKNAGE